MLKWWKLVHRFYWISFHGEFTNKRFSRAYTYKSKVKEMLCGIFSLWYLTYKKSFQRNKTEIFELRIVLRSWQHVFWNFPEFESCFICNLVSAKLILSDSSCYNGHFDALFYLGSFWFSLVGPRPRSWLSLYWTVILWSSFEWRYLQGHSTTDWILNKKVSLTEILICNV